MHMMLTPITLLCHPWLQLKDSVEEEPTVKVKISGDGARMSHTSSLFVCSFSLLEEGQRMLSSASISKKK